MVVSMLVMAVPTVFAGETHIVFDQDSGTTVITTVGIDTSGYHTGQTAQVNTFIYSGNVEGTYDSFEYNNPTNSFGKLNTFISAKTDGGGGGFQVNEYMDFNILSANHIYNTEGFFTAGASGAYAEMNMKFIGSMYVWSEADDSGANCLIGQNIWKNAWVNQSNVLQGEIYIGITTDGQAQMWNAGDWGFGIGEHGTVTADYGSGLNYISATGSGTYSQWVYGNDYAEINGIVLLGGTGGLPFGFGGPFFGGLTGTYTMEGN